MSHPPSAAFSPRRLIAEYAANAEQSDLAEFVQEFADGCPPEVLNVLVAMLTRSEGPNPSVADLFDAPADREEDDTDPDFAWFVPGIKVLNHYPRGSMAQQVCLEEKAQDARYLQQIGDRVVNHQVLVLAAGVLEVLQTGANGSAARLHAIDDLVEIAAAMKPPQKSA